jgi:hypothetical protein
MTESAFDRLIDEVLDGSASPADERRLRERMARDPGLKGRYEEMEGVFQVLGHWSASEAPTELRSAVMRQIGERARRREVSTDWAIGLRAALRGTVARQGLVFASGVLVGAFALGLVRGGVGPAGRDLPVTGSLPVTGTRAPEATRLDVAGLSLTAMAGSDSELLSVALSGQADGPFEIAWRPQDDLDVLGIERLRDGQTITLGPDRVMVDARGAVAFRLTFRRTGPLERPFELMVRSGDRTARGTVIPSRIAAPDR